MPDKEATRVGFGPRAAAYIIDRVILLAAILIVRIPFGIFSLFGGNALTAKDFLFDFSVFDVVRWLLISAYFVLMTYYTGSTLGKKVMRLRVEKEDGAAPGIVDVLYRETIGRFLSGIICFGYLMVLADRKNRAFHDYLCETRVVYDDVTVRIREKENTAPAWTPVETPVLLPDAISGGWSVPGERVNTEED